MDLRLRRRSDRGAAGQLRPRLPRVARLAEEGRGALELGGGRAAGLHGRRARSHPARHPHSRVYTPPELRRNGYASACVAALSQRMLDEGREICFLFTDIENPTSNRIYQEIGYEKVCAMNRYSIDALPHESSHTRG